MNRLLAEVLGILALLGIFTLYERHQGAQACLASDAQAVAKQGATNTRAQIKGAQIVSQEAIDYVHLTSAPLAPTPTVRRPPRVQPPAVPLVPGPAVPTPATGSCPDGETFLRAQDEAERLRGNINTLIRSDVQPAHDADAQVSGLQDYIVRVCKAPS